MFARDKYTCQICKKKGGILHTHHIIHRKDGGSDKADNLVTVHDYCHTGFHKGEIPFVFKKHKLYKEPPFMNAFRLRAKNLLGCDLTYGYQTAVKRKGLGLSKSHVNDAIAIADPREMDGYTKLHTMCIKQFRKKKRSLHEANPRKGKITPNRTQKRNDKNTKAQDGFFLNDKLFIFGQVGFISGFFNGGAYIKNTEGEYLSAPGKKYKQISSFYLKTAKRICHNNNWQTEYKKQTARFPHGIEIPSIPAGIS